MDEIFNTLDQNGYTLEIKYRDTTDYCCICNPNLLSRSYEYLNYSIIDYKDGIFGFFVTKNGIIYASCVVDLRCSNVCPKIREIPSYNDEVFTNYAEISLLCSNHERRVIGLASLLLDFVKIWVKKFFNKEYLVLSLANPHQNPNAFQFYLNNGFEQLGNSFIFVYKIS